MPSCHPPLLNRSVHRCAKVWFPLPWPPLLRARKLSVHASLSKGWNDETTSRHRHVLVTNSKVGSFHTGHAYFSQQGHGKASQRKQDSPSQVLVDVLQAHRISAAVPRFASREQVRWTIEDQANSHPSSDETGFRRRPRENRTESDLRLHDVLAFYIDAYYKRKTANATSDTHMTTAAQNIPHGLHFSPDYAQVSDLLHTRGFTWEDVELWRYIITARDDSSAIRELLEYVVANDSIPAGVGEPPPFVFLFFLRRARMSAEALKSCLEYATILFGRLEMEKKQVSDPSSGKGLRPATPRPLDRMSLLIIVVRLIRHARQTFPEALVSIAHLFMKLPTFVSNRQASQRQRMRMRPNAIRTAMIYNRVLKLLALPPKATPYQAVPFMQQAQFDLIGRMASHDPPLAINREGYRAICQVQLANRKTEREQDWASLKAKTWPPWKEDKMGFDAEKDSEYGTSQALAAIRKAQEAGYGSRMWEQIAGVLSGFDTDRSPTIQTRAYLLHVRLGRGNRHSKHLLQERLWYARIRATRTVQEAWAGFLNYEDQLQGKSMPGTYVYLAMFEKLHAHHKAINTASKPLSNCGVSPARTIARRDYGGDAKEPLPVQASPKEQTYVRVQPPGMDELAAQMRAKGVQPDRTCFAFLIANAQSAESGLEYLGWASETEAGVEFLLNPMDSRQSDLNKVAQRLFGAYVQLLCNHPMSAALRDRAQANGHQAARLLHDPSAFVAYRLMRIRDHNDYKSWHAVASRMMTTPLPPALRRMLSTNSLVEPIERWGFVKSIVEQMQVKDGYRVDGNFFMLLHRAIASAINSAKTILYEHEIAAADARPSKVTSRKSRTSAAFLENVLNSAPRPSNGKDQSSKGALTVADRVLRESSVYLRRSFTSLFGQQEGSTSQGDNRDALQDQSPGSHIPTLLTTPYPSILHAYVRSIGLLGDWQAMTYCVRWLCKHKKDINEAADVPANGIEMRRKTIVALRVFTERCWLNKTVVDKLQNEETDSERFHRQSDLSLDSKALPRSAAPQEIRDKIRALVDDTPEWGGWPSDDEVSHYCFGPTAGDFPPT